MSFSPLVVLRDTTVDNRWVLQAPLIYEDEEYRIVVHKGFDFDFASVPNVPIISNLFPRAGTKSDKPSCLHDALYSCQKLPKEVCDMLLKRALGLEAVEEFKRDAMYWAVDKFGQGAWKECAKTAHEYQYYVSIEYKATDLMSV